MTLKHDSRGILAACGHYFFYGRWLPPSGQWTELKARSLSTTVLPSASSSFCHFPSCRTKTSWGPCSFLKMSSKPQTTARRRSELRGREEENTAEENGEGSLVSIKQNAWDSESASKTSEIFEKKKRTEKRSRDCLATLSPSAVCRLLLQLLGHCLKILFVALAAKHFHEICLLIHVIRIVLCVPDLNNRPFSSWLLCV